MRHFKEWRNYVIFVQAYMLLFVCVTVNEALRTSNTPPYWRLELEPPLHNDSLSILILLIGMTIVLLATVVVGVWVGVWVLNKVSLWIMRGELPFMLGKLLGSITHGVAKGYNDSRPPNPDYS